MSFIYNATVFTSNERGAGTDENIYLRLIGTQGTDGDYELDTSRFDDFEAGSTKSYQIKTDQFLGDIKELYLYVEPFDNDNPAWKLDYIEISSLITGEIKKWKFPVYSWVGIPGRDAGKPDVINYLWIDQSGVYNKEQSSETYNKK
ncbi:hypothetical protein HFP66_01555 [Bacillus sp. A17A.1]